MAQAQALQQGPWSVAERGQTQSAGELKALVAEDGEGQVKASRHLLLVVRGLRAESIDGRPQALERGEVVPEGAILRGTSPRSRDVVPAGG